MKYKIKLIIILSMFFQQSSFADTIRFKGGFYDFRLQLEGSIKIIEKESEINSMLEAFILDKGDFDRVIKYYDVESVKRIKEIVKTPEGKKGFMDRLQFIDVIRARATIQEDKKTNALFQVNEGSSGSLIILGEVVFLNEKPYLKYVDNTMSPANSPYYWLLQIWNSFQSVNPTVVK